MRYSDDDDGGGGGIAAAFGHLMCFQLSASFHLHASHFLEKEVRGQMAPPLLVHSSGGGGGARSPPSAECSPSPLVSSVVGQKVRREEASDVLDQMSPPSRAPQQRERRPAAAAAWLADAGIKLYLVVKDLQLEYGTGCYTGVTMVTRETDVLAVPKRCQSYDEYLQTVCAPRIHLALAHHHRNCCHWRIWFKFCVSLKE